MHTPAPLTPPPAQDPAYPVYVDSSVIMGMTGPHDGTGFQGITYMECRPDNDFFPDLSKVRCWCSAVRRGAVQCSAGAPPELGKHFLLQAACALP